jgi:predicted dehydrogenase
VAGPVAELRALSAHRSDALGGDDVITVQMKFRSGMTGTLTNLASTPFYSRITLFGDAGWVDAREWSNVDVPEPALLSWRWTGGELHTQTFAPRDTPRANVEAWAAAARGERTYRFTTDELIHNAEIIEAIVRSAAEGGSIVTPGESTPEMS